MTICTNKHPTDTLSAVGADVCILTVYLEVVSNTVTDTDAELFCDKRRSSSLHLHHNFKGARALVHREHI